MPTTLLGMVVLVEICYSSIGQDLLVYRDVVSSAPIMPEQTQTSMETSVRHDVLFLVTPTIAIVGTLGTGSTRIRRTVLIMGVSGVPKDVLA